MSDSNIYEFDDLENLKESMIADLEEFNISSNRFPIRFIFLNSHDELKEVVELLKDEMKVDIIRLSNFLDYSKDGWLTTAQVIKQIKKLNNNSVVVPFSEYIRFLKPEDFYNILKGLSEIEKNNMRIYIPLVGLWQRFDDYFWKNFYRKDNWAPIWKLNTPHRRINVYQINFDFDDRIEINNMERVSNSTEWFNLWKKSNVKDIISFSNPLRIYFNNTLPDQTFDRKIIENPREYLLYVFDLDLGIQYNDTDDKYWNRLLVDISKNNNVNISLKDIFMDKFNINNIDELEIEDFLNYYLSSDDDYDKWITKNVFLSFDKYKDSYLSYCFKSLPQIGRYMLAEKILFEIFEFEGYCRSFLEERRKLLKYFNYYDFISFEERLNDVLDEILTNKALSSTQQFNYLTDTTKTEKRKIFEIINIDNIKSILPKLKVIFPDLYHYLDWDITLDNDDFPIWVIDYLKEYNKSKLLNEKTSELEKLLVKHNHPNNIRNWHYNLLDNYDSTVSENSYEIWIDGMGAEWFPLFTHFLNEFGKANKKKIQYQTIIAVDLPSATKFNKKDEKFKQSNLDEYIHDNLYDYPDLLLGEIEIIKYLAEKIALSNCPKATIVSDHGLSCLCVSHFGNTKKYDFDNVKVEHEGRYFLVDDKEYFDNDDYFVHECESIGFEGEKYVISLNHTSLDKTPIREVHGGATPEEVLVPYIVFGYDNKSNQEYNVLLSNNEVNILKDKEIEINISPKPKSLPIAIWNNESLNVNKKDNKFFIQVDSLNEGIQKIIIKINNIKIDEIELNIKKSGMAVRKYDFG